MPSLNSTESPSSRLAAKRREWPSMNLSWLNLELDYLAHRGRWKKYARRPQITHFGIEPSYRCGLDKEEDADAMRRTGLFYSWEAPADYPWLSLEPSFHGSSVRFRVEDFCAALRGRPVVIVGDSVQGILASALQVTMPGHFFGRLKMSSTHHDQLHICVNFTGVQPSIVKYVRNDFLNFTPWRFIGGGLSKQHSMGYEWLSHASTNNSIICLNRGHHFEPTETLLNQINETLVFLRQFDSLVIYRATNLPIPKANFTKEPLDFPLPLQNIHGSKENLAHESYHWDAIHEQNVAVKRLLREEFPHVVYLDIEWMSRFRTDSMRDSVHCCIPGVANEWLALFAHAIMRLDRVGLH